MVLQLAESY